VLNGGFLKAAGSGVLGLQARGRLTPWEAEVAVHLAAGHDYATIAALLGVSLRTVDVEHILSKLACTGRTQAATRALALGLVTTWPKGGNQP
jgi:DNA-binding NarL/FixJ family response regulator